MSITSSSSRRSSNRRRSAGRGRSADTPEQVPARGWWDILKRTFQQLNEDNLSIVAGGVAFYAFLAIVPAMGALIALYGLLADPAQVTSHLNTLEQVVPAEAMPILQEQLTRIAQNQPAAGWSALIGFAVALFSSIKGTKALMQGLNIAYDERECRGIVKLHAVALLLTLGGILGVIAMVALVAVIPAIIELIRLPQSLEGVMAWLRWPVMIVLFVGALAALYRFGPSRDAPRWRWLSWGAITGALVWLGGSAAFSLYVSSFGNYDKTYGSLGAVVVFLLWLYLSAYAILLGAELNAEAERQTEHDTTAGEDQPMGSRQAYAADTVGPEQ